MADYPPLHSFASATCATFLARTIFSSLQETLGSAFFGSLWKSLPAGELELLLSNAAETDSQFPLHLLGDFFAALEKTAGERGCRGVLQRSGHVWFAHLQRRSSPPLGIFTPAVLTLPKKLKVKRCGELLAAYFNRYLGIEFVIEPSPEALKWFFLFPPSHSDAPLSNGFCDLWLGFWDELLYTLSGGKHHLLQSIAEVTGKRPCRGLLIPYLPFEG